MSKALDEVTLETDTHPIYARATKQFRLFICGAFGPSSCWALLDEARDQSTEGCRRRGQSCARERKALTLHQFLLRWARSPPPPLVLQGARARTYMYDPTLRSLEKVGSFRNCYFNYLPGPGTDSQHRLPLSLFSLCKFDFFIHHGVWVFFLSHKRCGAFQALHSCLRAFGANCHGLRSYAIILADLYVCKRHGVVDSLFLRRVCL
jgi:hypothetical protein